eukprot:gene38444-46724_t
MSAKAIREYHGKKLVSKWLPQYSSSQVYNLEDRALLITPNAIRPEDPASLDAIAAANPWLLETKLVVKPDQLIKRRGKAGLLAINKTWPEVVQWIKERMNKECKVEVVTGILDHFIVEPFVPHQQSDEYYLCLQSFRYNEEILFYHEGGVDVGDVDAKGVRLELAINEEPTVALVKEKLLQKVPAGRQDYLAGFIVALVKLFRELNFVYMEINPLVMTDDGRITPLDMAAKIDETAHFLNGTQWGSIEFPAPFGRAEFPEEAFIKKLDQASGSSLKLTILNQYGRIWTMVAGIANFTDVAATFTGIQKAMKQYREELLENKVQIWVRRAGPNYQEGLKNMRITADELGLPMHLYGPETHITAVVPLALGLRDPKDYPEFDAAQDNRNMMAAAKGSSSADLSVLEHSAPYASELSASGSSLLNHHKVVDLTPDNRAIVYGLQTVAVQGMLDFDFMCKRKKPSVACMVFPFSGNHYSKLYWGTEETLIPVYTTIAEAVAKHPEVSIMINFASFRSVYETVEDALQFSQTIKTIAIIAEGVPESQTRKIIRDANAKGVGIIGPATVGGIKPGCFRIGNTGGMLDNIIMSKLYRPGSVAYVSKSGGMSNELNNIIARNSDGVYEGVAIGGDRYPGSLFLDHLLRYNDNPEVKMMVLLGEVGGIDEYAVCEAIKSGRITKPLVAWVMGTCASIFPYEVQFGHAGAMARGDLETAAAKNSSLREAGAFVPKSFDAI